MLRLPRFSLSAPASLEDALRSLSDSDARLLAGGTDLLPNLKHHLERPSQLISLHRLTALRSIVAEPSRLRIGCGVTLARIAEDADTRARFPSLAQAAESVASPQIRARATLGGNIHLEPRCRYVNQTELWRSAIGGCLKSEGDVCHVVPKGKNCVAALSSDTVPALISLNASLVLVGPEGEREVPLGEYFSANGLSNTGLMPGELATEVRLPLPEGTSRAVYVKWRPRGSIDFPLVSVALRFDLDASTSITEATAVLGVLGAKPRAVDLSLVARGRALSEVATDVAELVHKKCKPLANVPYDPAYRRHLARVLTRRAVERLARG